MRARPETLSVDPNRRRKWRVEARAPQPSGEEDRSRRAVMLLACELLLADLARSGDPGQEWKVRTLKRLRSSLLMCQRLDEGSAAAASAPAAEAADSHGRGTRRVGTVPDSRRVRDGRR
jgi:hypothetical protein